MCAGKHFVALHGECIISIPHVVLSIYMQNVHKMLQPLHVLLCSCVKRVWMGGTIVICYLWLHMDELDW